MASDPIPAVRLYSPTQVACGTIGGPVGLIYFLWSNFRALGNTSYSHKTLLYGAACTVILVLISPLLPDHTSIGFTVAYVFLGRYVAETHQMSKFAIATTAGYGFQSNWRVLWLGIACLIGTLAAIASIAMLAGIIKGIGGA